jgi:hypothetical protein
VGRERLRAAHAGDKAAGLSERQIADLHAHFVACEGRQQCCCRCCRCTPLPLDADHQGLLAMGAPLFQDVVLTLAATVLAAAAATAPARAIRLPCPAPVCRHADMQQLARSSVVDGEPRLRQRVVGTAAIYWRKFYLKNDFCSPGGDPRLMAPACLFLASKTGEPRLQGGRSRRCGHSMPGWAPTGGCLPSLTALPLGPRALHRVGPVAGPSSSPRILFKHTQCCCRHRHHTPAPPRPGTRHAPPPPAEETPIQSKLLLHYARRLCAKHGALPPPDLAQLASAEALLLVRACCTPPLAARVASLPTHDAGRPPIVLSCSSAGRGKPWPPCSYSSLSPFLPVFPSFLVFCRAQEQLDGDLLVFSPYPSLSAFLRDAGLASSRKTCEAAW